MRAYEAATGTTMPRPDDVSVEPDDRWQDETSGDPVGDRYWDAVARRAGLDGIVELFRVLGKEVPEALFDAGAVTLIQDACSAAVPVGILSNHAHMVLGREWFAARPEFGGVTAFIDAAEIGVPKPDPQGYLIAAQALGVAPDEVVFLDDTPACAEGARAVGMSAILVDRA